MRMPIQYALTYPERVASNDVRLDWGSLRRLDFEPVSHRRFPCLGLAREALRQGGVDITGGIPSDIYVGIGRDRYEDDGGDYELAADVANAIRERCAASIRNMKGVVCTD
jgi:1-deoxy-D-xylulose-5-phosphate reductoisomerase